MNQNKYDDDVFFNKYSNMNRSKNGLEGAGEWHELKKMMPNFKDKRVLDLGCGFGWHCRYAVENGAKSVIGIDISQKMLSEAKNKTKYGNIEYICMPIEDIDFPEESFEVVISSLALHYIKSFEDVLDRVYKCLSRGGDFVFSIEHPIFTAQGPQDWYYDDKGNILHWPVDHYFTEGIRNAKFLGEEVIKYHRTLTTYLNSLIKIGFEITGVVEPEPEENMLNTVPGMLDELRRPMMLLVSARKK
ncbi:class I SAM-dependent methyltransferase [Acetivibrio clariflavus]|uniref:Methylase involved in ubiquinone/menaquinone biosynthesis n=1 Tax=Acetivibrio clariflavus (strain DSM 19732 / NBRC 101661 / EBR45) TaxID=720554 RepID=G8M090_ACECE|nr:class I SAM-dependent methyltransferase [Acetivibrio clariflavus]AEV66897.1 methylase involved in ubiquinone/menaquinone biosynthesis [Acetivibrio clariflavus DSM 19732]